MGARNGLLSVPDLRAAWGFTAMSTALDTSWIRGGRIPCLDGYRGIGTLLIVFGHCADRVYIPIPALDRLYRALLWSDIALNLFFVLSGFLITHLLLREWNANGRISLRGFYRRRFLRIIPPYIPYLVVACLLQIGGVLAISGNDWLGALTYTTNFHVKTGWELGHFWSLSVEEHFYLIWPAIIAFLGMAGGRWALVICIVCAPLMRFWSHAHLSEYLNVENCTINYMDVIAFGAGLAFLCQSERFRGLTARLQPIGGWLMICACVGLPGSAWLQNRSDTYWIFAHRTVTGFLCAALIYLSVAFANKWVRRILNWRLLVALGVVSYSVYIWQQLFTGKSGLPEWFLTWPTNLVFIASAATLSYYLIERPFARIKDRKDRKAIARSEKRIAESRPACVPS
jgi:peptidoglycan/LPS O-acetylase OafA/YrhL